MISVLFRFQGLLATDWPQLLATNWPQGCRWEQAPSNGQLNREAVRIGSTSAQNFLVGAWSKCFDRSSTKSFPYSSRKQMFLSKNPHDRRRLQRRAHQAI